MHLTDEAARNDYVNRHRDDWQSVLITLPPVTFAGGAVADLRLPK